MRKLNALCVTLLGACAIALSPAALADGPEHDHNGSHAHGQQKDKPINRTCPISGERTSASSPTIEYKGQVIAFCCPGCQKPFKNWSEKRKREYVAAALGKESRRDDGEQKASKKESEKGDNESDGWKGDPYTLNVCPISDMKLGSMGEPPVKEYDGREVRFCCAGCFGKFEKNMDKEFAEIDKKLIKQQLPYYPLNTCLVSGESLTEWGEPINRIYKNRLVRFCCKMCIKEFEKNPDKVMSKLDEAVIKKQKEDYPLEICPVSGAKLGSMGDPVDIVVGNRLVRFCCASCKPKFMKDPAKYLAKIDEAWGEKPGQASGSESKDHGHNHEHDGHGHDHNH